MPLVKFGPVDSLPPGGVAELENNGSPYAICNVDGKVFCTEGVCPHAGGPLGQGTLNGSMLVCPWHGWEFDCRSGVNDFDEDVQIQTYPVVVQNGDLFVDLP